MLEEDCAVEELAAFARTGVLGLATCAVVGAAVTAGEVTVGAAMAAASAAASSFTLVRSLASLIVFRRVAGQCCLEA